MPRQHLRSSCEILSRYAIDLGVQAKSEDHAQENYRKFLPHQPNLD
jgi:hypothetical protein